MNPLRAAMVIARRDYVASVFSRTFLFFLIGPLLPLLAGGVFGAVGANIDREEGRPAVAVIAAPEAATAIGEARAALAARLGPDALPDIRAVPPAGPIAAQTRALLGDTTHKAVAVLAGGLDAPVLTGPAASLRQVRRDIGLILDRARTDRALGADGIAPVTIAERAVEQAAGADARSRSLVARFGQLILMFLTLLLTGMMLSNMVEEKSNKVIEVLTAAVPVDGIFFGKIVAMLGLSLTGIAVWGAAAGLAYTMIPHGGMPPPAVGWPIYLALGVVYFASVYLLIGSLFLGIGAQASSVREVQTMSMPLTMAQLGLVAFASAAVSNPDGGMGLAAAILPWSSPFAMLARAAQDARLWPHLLAILWQAVWIAITIRVAARWFRASVLKSGRPGWIARVFKRRGRDPISV